MRTSFLNAVGWFLPVRRSRGAPWAAASVLLFLGPFIQVSEAQLASFAIASVADQEGNLHCLWERRDKELHYTKITAKGALEFSITLPLPELVIAWGSLAVDSLNKTHVVCNEGQYQTPSDSMYLFSFSPQGCLLSSRVLPSRYGGIHGLTAVCDPFDNLWIIAMNQRGVNHDLVCTKISPLGDVLLDEKRLTSDPNEDENPSAVSDPAGAIYVAWNNGSFRDYPYLDTEVYGLKIANDGKVLVPPKNLSRNSGRSWRQSLLLTRSGEVMVAWDDRLEFTGQLQVKLVRFSPDLERVADEIALSPRACEAWTPSLAADRDGNIFCAFSCLGQGLWLARLKENGEIIAPAHAILTTESNYPHLDLTSSSLRLTTTLVTRSLVTPPFESHAYFLEFDRELEEVRISQPLEESAPSPGQCAAFLRGDCNADGKIELSDAVCSLAWLFQGGATPDCIAATNTDGVGTVDLTDPIYLLNHLFLGGPPPVAPYPECGVGTLPEDEGTCKTPPENCPM